jgi:uncharacterized protein YndB with AHSA1/START domain
MSEYGIVTEAGAVRFERLLPGPIEHVWAYLTQLDKRGTWLAAGPMDSRVGGRVDLHFHHAELSAEKTPPERYKELENGHLVRGSITRCEPPRLLSFTWGEWGEVTFELTPQDDDVLLVLTHRRLADRAATAEIAGGWHAHLGILTDRLAGREPRPFWSTHATVAAEYQKRIATE